MRCFLADYPAGRHEGRYLAGALPRMPFADGCFDLALCSHFLFLYEDKFDAAFHVQSIVELCRVADEIRIFPLLALDGKKSRHLPVVSAVLERSGYECRVVKVDYEFQRGGNRMLVVKPRENRRRKGAGRLR